MKQIKKECLKAIMQLSEEGQTVWPASLVNKLELSIREIKDILSSLEEKGFVEENERGVLVLTADGYEKASQYYKRRKVS